MEISFPQQVDTDFLELIFLAEQGIGRPSANADAFSGILLLLASAGLEVLTVQKDQQLFLKKKLSGICGETASYAAKLVAGGVRSVDAALWFDSMSEAEHSALSGALLAGGCDENHIKTLFAPFRGESGVEGSSRGGRGDSKREEVGWNPPVMEPWPDAYVKVVRHHELSALLDRRTFGDHQIISLIRGKTLPRPQQHVIVYHELRDRAFSFDKLEKILQDFWVAPEKKVTVQAIKEVILGTLEQKIGFTDVAAKMQRLLVPKEGAGGVLDETTTTLDDHLPGEKKTEFIQAFWDGAMVRGNLQICLLVVFVHCICSTTHTKNIHRQISICLRCEVEDASQ